MKLEHMILFENVLSQIVKSYFTQCSIHPKQIILPNTESPEFTIGRNGREFWHVGVFLDKHESILKFNHFLVAKTKYVYNYIYYN